MPGSAVLGSADCVLARVVLGLAAGPTGELSVGTTVGAAGGLVVDAPLTCETATNALVSANIPVPLAFGTGSALSAALGGSMTSSGGSDLAVETVTAQQQNAAVNVPVVLLFETTVGGGDGGGVTAAAPRSFATAAGARSRVRIRPDGRAAVLLPGRYRR